MLEEKIKAQLHLAREQKPFGPRPIQKKKGKEKKKNESFCKQPTTT